MDEIKQFILRALLKADGFPLQQSTLVASVQMVLPRRPAAGDVGTALRSLEDEGYVAGTEMGVRGVHWTLTAKGKLEAQQL